MNVIYCAACGKYERCVQCMNITNPLQYKANLIKQEIEREFKVEYYSKN